MKAVVLDIKRNKVAVMSDEGLVLEFKNKGYSVGQTIEMEDAKMFKNNRKLINSLAGVAAALLIVFGGSALALNVPVAEVSLDVNPSILYTVNMFDNVIEVTAENSDADPIVSTIDWKGKNISDVLSETITALQGKGYLLDDQWYKESMVVGVNATSAKLETKLVEQLRSEIESVVKEQMGEDVNLDNEDVVIGIGKERVDLAKALSDQFSTTDAAFKVTPGKLNLVQKLYANDENWDFANLTAKQTIIVMDQLGRPVKDIMADIKTNKKADSQNSSQSQNGNAFGKDKVKNNDNTENTNDQEDVVQNNGNMGNGDSNQNGNNNGQGNGQDKVKTPDGDDTATE